MTNEDKDAAAKDVGKVVDATSEAASGSTKTALDTKNFRLPSLGWKTPVAVGVAALLGVWGVGSLANTNAMESDLASRSATELAANGFVDVAVSFDGRDATLTGFVESNEDIERATQLVRKREGVRDVNTKLVSRRPGTQLGSDTADETPTSEITVASTVVGVEEVTSTIEPETTTTIAEAVAAEAATTTVAETTTTTTTIVAQRPGMQGFSASETATSRAQALREALAARSVHFVSGSSILTVTGTSIVNEVHQYLVDEPDARVSIEGHADRIGTTTSNQTLSEARAQTVRDALIASGIAGERLTVVGYGESRPVAKNATSSGRALNRRVEFVVLASNAG